MLTQTSKFRGEILRKIYRVWLIRRLLPVLFLEIIVLSVALYFLGRAVFVQRVLENAFNILFSNPSKIVFFGISAFINAAIATKVITLLVAVFLALVLRSITQGILRLLLVRENYFARIEK